MGPDQPPHLHSTWTPRLGRPCSPGYAAAFLGRSPLDSLFISRLPTGCPDYGVSRRAASTQHADANSHNRGLVRVYSVLILHNGGQSAAHQDGQVQARTHLHSSVILYFVSFSSWHQLPLSQPIECPLRFQYFAKSSCSTESDRRTAQVWKPTGRRSHRTHIRAGPTPTIRIPLRSRRLAAPAAMGLKLPTSHRL